MKDFTDLLEYRRIFPPVLSVCFFLYFVFLKDRFGVGSEFNTTLFLIAVVLTSFSVSFVWKFFDMERRAINLPFIRVFVDYALKFNPEARMADLFMSDMNVKFLELAKNTTAKDTTAKDTTNGITQISIPTDIAINSYILFQLKKNVTTSVVDGFNTVKIQYNYKELLIDRTTPLGRSVRINSLNSSYTLGRDKVMANQKVEGIDDILNEDYFFEVEISKINAGEKKREILKTISKKIELYPMDKNGRIIFESNIKAFLNGLQHNCVIKKYEIKDNIAHYTLNEAVVRWHHRDYLGNSYNKLEECLSKKLLESKPLVVFGALFFIIFTFIFILFISKWSFIACLTTIILPFCWQKLGDLISCNISNVFIFAVFISLLTLIFFLFSKWIFVSVLLLTIIILSIYFHKH